jgi:hypothetical protein
MHTASGKGQNYENQNVESFHKRDQNVERSEQQQLPMAYSLWIPRPVGVSLGSVRLG